MSVFKCKMCGGSLEIQNNQTTAICEYCGTLQTLPRLSDERRANLYDHASHFRRNNEFDKAAGIYESILSEDTSDAEAYWSLVLCRYGIEYVKDPATRKRVPTVNRAQFTSIFDDENYKSALTCADSYQRILYEQEASIINEIQKGILAISQKENPFDVFICYKETDSGGRRTLDSVLATELYHQLVSEGFKVFFSRITLEDKLGIAYEPYIFAALNSARVMVVLGTRPEHFNAAWVKNEWSRYLALVKQSGGKKHLIPAYRDMDPYDLPEEFSHLQAQDMNKLGFMLDLIHGIKKLAPVNTPASVNISINAAIPPLLKRFYMFLEDEDWEAADECCEKVLDMDPENAEAYLGKILAQMHCHTREALGDGTQLFTGNPNYAKVLRFGSVALKAELQGYIDSINHRNEQIRLEALYQNAEQRLQAAKTEKDYMNAAALFAELSGYKDAQNKANACTRQAQAFHNDALYRQARIEQKKGQLPNLGKALQLFLQISGWKDADAQAQACRARMEALKAEAEHQQLEVARLAELQRLEKEQRAAKARKAAKARATAAKKIAAVAVPVAAAAVVLCIALNAVIIPAIKQYRQNAEAAEEPTPYVEVLTPTTEPRESQLSEAQLQENKYNVAVAMMEAGQFEEAIAAFAELTGYRDSDALLQDCHYNAAVVWIETKQFEKAFAAIQSFSDSWPRMMELWGLLAQRDSIAGGGEFTVGLKADGTVITVGKPPYSQVVRDWSEIIAVSANGSHTVGLLADGTVVATGRNDDGQCNVDNWRNIVTVDAGSCHTVGLQSNGTVVATGKSGDGQCDVGNWENIIAVAAGGSHTTGLRADGTVVATGKNYAGQCDVGNWENIIAISAGGSHTVGLRADGTVVVAGSNHHNQGNTGDWSEIVAIAAGFYSTVGLRADGTVVAVGSDIYPQCDVEDWSEMVAIASGPNHTIGLRADGTVVTVGCNHHGMGAVGSWTDILLP